MVKKVFNKKFFLIIALALCAYLIGSLLIGAKWVFRVQMYFSHGRNVIDSNGDGKPDYWEYFKDGKLVESAMDLNKDGKPDVWSKFGPNEELIELDIDFDYDGKVDYRELWENGFCIRIDRERPDGTYESMPCPLSSFGGF